MRGDFGHHLMRGIFARMARPGDATFGDEDGDVRLRARLPQYRRDRANVAIGREPGAIGIDVRHCGGESDAAQGGVDRLQPRHRQAEQIAALLRGESVDFIDDDGLQIGEHQRRVGIAEQQRERFGRGEEDVRGLDALARLAIRGRVAGAGFDADRERHVLDRGQQIAADVHG